MYLFLHFDWNAAIEKRASGLVSRVVEEIFWISKEIG